MAADARYEKDAKAAREAKLAQALRANLRRRKAGDGQPASNPDKTDEQS